MPETKPFNRKEQGIKKNLKQEIEAVVLFLHSPPLIVKGEEEVPNPIPSTQIKKKEIPTFHGQKREKNLIRPDGPH